MLIVIIYGEYEIHTLAYIKRWQLTDSHFLVHIAYFIFNLQIQIYFFQF